MIPPNIQEIISRHEKTLAACGDKLMGAERDLSVVLEFIRAEIAEADEPFPPPEQYCQCRWNEPKIPWHYRGGIKACLHHPEP